MPSEDLEVEAEDSEGVSGADGRVALDAGVI
jgi:hypothetical protein